MPLVDLSHRPTGWLRVVLKAPTYLYRAHLGFVFGKRFVMIEHRGRRSGRRYRTVVEVAGRTDTEWICTSGTGPEADWYRNLRANGAEAVWIGARRRGASVRFLEPTEAASFMAAYESEHPRTAAKLYEVMGVSYDGTDEDRVLMMSEIPMVAL
jgi:deazaflavin-dependent oxidoreductase (nitroreductase family)